MTILIKQNAYLINHTTLGERLVVARPSTIQRVVSVRQVGKHI